MKEPITTIDEAINFLQEHAKLTVVECPFNWQVFQEGANNLFFLRSNEDLIAFACKERDSLTCSDEPSNRLKGGNT